MRLSSAHVPNWLWVTGGRSSCPGKDLESPFSRRFLIVVARQSRGGLSQIVGAEAKNFGFLGDVAGCTGAPMPRQTTAAWLARGESLSPSGTRGTDAARGILTALAA